MDVTLSPEQLLLQDTARALARQGSPGADADRTTAWKALADAGLTALLAPVEHGGQGATVLDAVLVAEALAAHLYPAPYAGACLLATELLAAAGVTGDAWSWMATGDDAPAVALTADLGGLHRADRDGTTGSAVAWDCAPSAVVVALDAAGDAVIAGADVSDPVDGFDRLRSFRRLDVPGGWREVGPVPAGGLARWQAIAHVAVAADMLGVMDGSLRLAVAHAGQRQQFGRPIGSFQAVQQLCADAHVHVEATRSVVYAAAAQLDAGEPPPAHAHATARLADAYASAHVRPVVEAALQVHGGIGMTWEHPGHHYLRRGLVDRATFGDERRLHAAIGAGLLAGSPLPTDEKEED